MARRPDLRRLGALRILARCNKRLSVVAGYQPVGREPDSYEVAFFEERAEITRRDGAIVTATEILVSPEDDAEVRRVSITNTGSRACEIELTTYSEVVLTTPDADSAHPALAKLFVQTEFVRRQARCLPLDAIESRPSSSYGPLW